MTSPSFRLWSTDRSTWCNQEVTGVSYRRAAIERLFPRSWNRRGEELTLDVELIPEPENEHDHNAISVRVAGTLLGYLPAAVAADWARTIRRIVDSDCTPITNGRIYLYESTDWLADPPSVRTSIRFDIRLPDTAEVAVPLNDPPAVPYTILPRSGIVQVTKEGDHLDALLRFVPPSGHGLMYATLHRDVVRTARTSRDVVAVHLDGERAGELTPTMSARFLPMIDHLTARELTPACWADITGSSVAAEVRIDAVKAHEISDDILDGPPVTAPKLVPEILTDWWFEIRTPPQYRTPPRDPRAARKRTSSPDKSCVPADWYPDPDNTTLLRYWDGSGWTEHTAPRGSQL